MKHITASELAILIADINHQAPLLLDVREPWEYKKCHIPMAKLMPINSVPNNITKLNKQESIICICHHGVRSMRIATFLEEQGFINVMNLIGGIHAWAIEVDKKMPRY